jgi:hypothetical protein
MENLIICTALYLVAVAIAYCPERRKVAAPINYFPEVEETTDWQEMLISPRTVEAVKKVTEFMADQLEPEPAPEPTKTEPKPTLSTLLKDEFVKPLQDVKNLPIRELYQMAAAAGLKNVKKMTKAQLIEALA